MYVYIYTHILRKYIHLCENVPPFLTSYDTQFVTVFFHSSIYKPPQHTVTHCNTPQHTALYCTALHHTITHCTALQHIEKFYFSLETTTHCTAPHRTAPHYNIVDRTTVFYNTREYFNLSLELNVL